MLNLYWYSENMRNGDVFWSISNIKEEPRSVLSTSINKPFSITVVIRNEKDNDITVTTDFNECNG